MRYVRLGKTGLIVSRVALGAWAFGGEWGKFDEVEATDAIEYALGSGVNFFDTAQTYGFGASERFLASALWPRVPRDRVILATKGGLRKEGSQVVRDASAGWLRAGVEASLRNLGTDYIDLYQVHWPDPDTPPEETAGVLEDLVREGKIRHVGVSNYSVPQMEELVRFGRVETLQPPYHLFRRDIETDILPYALANDIGVLAYGPLAHGLLSGRMTAETTFAPDDWRNSHRDFAGEAFRKNLTIVERLREYAEGNGTTLPALAVAWTLSHPAVHVALVGARRASQLSDTLAAAEMHLTDTEKREVEAVFALAAGVVGPSPEGN